MSSITKDENDVRYNKNGAQQIKNDDQDLMAVDKITSVLFKDPVHRTEYGSDNELTEDVEKHHRESRGKEQVQEALIKICREGFGYCVAAFSELSPSKIEKELIFENLVAYGADVHRVDKKGKTPLMTASEFGHEQVAEQILKFDTDIDAHDVKGYSALMFACENGHGGVAALLLNNGADIDAVNLKGTSSLMLAVENEHIEIVELLIRRGVDINDAGLNGVTVLMAACNRGNKDIVELLLRGGACVNTTSAFCGTVFIQMCYRGDTRMLDLLVEYGADVNEGKGGDVTPLLTACSTGREDVVEFLLQNGANVNATRTGGKHVLTIVCEENKASENIGRLLLQYGANVNASDKNGTTVLMSACAAERATFLKLLIGHEADIDIQCSNGKTAAMHAAGNGAINCLKSLIDAGANLDLTSKSACTVLSYALSYKPNAECVKLLLEGALIDDGKLKRVHKYASYSSSSLQSILSTINHRVFEWEFCPARLFKPVCFAAMRSGICPGRITYNNEKISPLILAFLENDSEVIETCLAHLYYFTEDYLRLSCDHDLRRRITNTGLLDRFTLHPLSLTAWSFLTVSKAISLAGSHNLRCQRVDALPVPAVIKKALTFQASYS